MLAPALAGLIALNAALDADTARLLTPPRDLKVSEWADEYRVVPGYSANAGRWVTALTPYLRDIMDSFSDPYVNHVVFKKCARVGATEAGLNVVGYYIDHDPSSIMIVQPTVDDAKDFSKEQLAPMIAETDVLRARVSEAVKDSKNTITAKVFPGGSVVLGGANSPRFFRRRTVRILILEEINGYGASTAARKEGSQIKLAEKRTETMGYRKKVYKNSTPTTKGECAISDEYDRSDQRRYYVPCPECHVPQPLEWDRLRYKDMPAPKYECRSCGHLIGEEDKDAMVAAGAWVAENPGHPVRGFHINALYSPFVRWQTLVDEYVTAQSDPEALRVFVNTALGEAWEDRAAKDLEETLKQRSRPYCPDGSWDVPRGACILVAGVDKQDAELHIVVRAYGPGEQSWLIDRHRLIGDTTQPAIWAELDAYRREKSWRHEGGATLKIRAMAIDSGDDPQPVYAYTKTRLMEYVFAIKGASDPTADILPKKFTKTSVKSRMWLIGTQVIKRRILTRAAMVTPEPYTLDIGRAFMHWNEQANDAYWWEFFSQTRETRTVRGKTVPMYVKKSGWRDESLDCEGYAYVALLLGPVSVPALYSEWESVLKAGEQAKKGTPEPDPAPDPAPSSSWVGRARGGGSWMGRVR